MMSFASRLGLESETCVRIVYFHSECCFTFYIGKIINILILSYTCIELFKMSTGHLLKLKFDSFYYTLIFFDRILCLLNYPRVLHPPTR